MLTILNRPVKNAWTIDTCFYIPETPQKLFGSIKTQQISVSLSHIDIYPISVWVLKRHCQYMFVSLVSEPLRRLCWSIETQPQTAMVQTRWAAFNVTSLHGGLENIQNKLGQLPGAL